MSFNVEPKVGPTIQNPTGASTNNSAQAARERAIARIAEQPVPDANRISPEELGAIKVAQPAPSEPESEATETTPPEDKLSSQYANLARKEKQLRARENQWKAEKAQYLSEIEKLKVVTPTPAIDESKYISKDRFTSDPLGTMQEAGLSYDQITQLLLNPPPAENPSTKAAIARMEAEIKRQADIIEKGTKSSQEAQSAQYKQAVAQITTEAKKLVMTDPAYEAVKATNSIHDVVELIEKTYAKEGILLTVEEAAQAVEDHITEEGFKLTRLQKIQKRLQTVAPSDTKTPAAPQQSQNKTLTNNMGTTRQLSARERALLAFKGELK